MSFLDAEFAWFLPLSLALWFVLVNRPRLRIGALLLGSLVFYGYDDHWIILVILAYAVVDWWTGLLIVRASRPKLVLVCGLSVNIGVLCFWKYTPLLVSTLSDALGWPSGDLRSAAVEGWILPLGVSFYAFTGIAYMVDVYRGAATPERNLGVFALYTAFYPHLVSGPILRAREFLVHLSPDSLPRRPIAVWEGAFLIARGYFKKAVLGDTIATAVDPFFLHVGTPATAGVWSLPYLYLYALQIYFDFSGYTDIARGLGLWFGFRWPENFHWPYLATSVQDFWRRWHMTLSRFLRDYLYVPLGGSRGGIGATARNLMITMALGGIWHGASWTFMLWGLLHGCYLVINLFWGRTEAARKLAALGGVPGRAWTLARIALTFHAVCLAWAFFRLTDFPDALACVVQAYRFESGLAMAGGAGDPALWLLIGSYALATCLAVAAARGKTLAEARPILDAHPFSRGAAWGAPLGLFLLAMLAAPGADTSPFIYFRF